MKRCLMVLCGLCLCSLLVTCAGSTNKPIGLLADANPETSVLTLYYCNKERILSYTWYDTEEERKILNELNALSAAPAEDALLADWSFPCYGLKIGGGDGSTLYVAYSHGTWLNQEGEVWSVKADLERLFQKVEAESEELGSILYFPNAGRLAKYCDAFYQLDEAVHSVDGITLAVYGLKDGVLSLNLQNSSGSDFEYSEYFVLEWYRDGAWYIVPPLEEIAFNDIAHILAAGSGDIVTCDLNPYGELTAGDYRIVKDGLTAEFGMDKNGNLNELILYCPG